jgi:hypothetical protein
VGLRPLVCSARIWYYTTVSKDQYTPLRAKRQTRQARNAGNLTGYCTQIPPAIELKNAGTPPNLIARSSYCTVPLNTVIDALGNVYSMPLPPD